MNNSTNRRKRPINVPAGIYSLDKVLDEPYVAGVAKRFHWEDIEPTEGVYDFSEIETIVRDAQAVGQSVTIANLLTREPAWLTAKIPPEDFYAGIQGTDIAPWNEDVLTAVEALATAQSNFEIDGIKLKDHPTVKQINCAIGTMTSIRMKTVPAGYTVDLLKYGIYRSIDAWVRAFPDKHLYTGLFGVSDGLQNTAENIRDELIGIYDGKTNPKLHYFIEFLTGKTPTVTNSLLHDVKDQVSLMMQACGGFRNQQIWTSCNWAENDSPETAFNHAMTNFNTTYFEIYYEDLREEPFRAQFETASSAIPALAKS